MIAATPEQVVPQLKIEPRGSEWWITGGADDYGPYTRRAEADDDRRGLLRTLRFQDEPGFVSVDPRPRFDSPAKIR